MFPPIFALERVSPAVEEALGHAMLARTRLEQNPKAKPPAPPKRITPNKRQREILRAIARGRNTAQLIGVTVGLSTTNASNAIRTLVSRGWVEVRDRIRINKSGIRSIYGLTPEGLEEIWGLK